MNVAVIILGVAFSQATEYVFGFPFMNETVLNETEVVAPQFYDFEDRNMSEWMMYMWTNFIREGLAKASKLQLISIPTC